jgi:hypothetical protein
MNRRDIELLSSYLDGQLKPSESARLESRLSSDADLRAVLDDLRSTRGLLRRLPMRKAPRNFTLTPKMVGKNPPLPRGYPAFRFVTALASLLLFFTVGLNFLAPQMASPLPSGGGGAPELMVTEPPIISEAQANEAPATEAPAEEPSMEMAPQATETIPSADTVREFATPAEKEGVMGNAPAQDRAPQPVPAAWQVILGVVALTGALVMVLMRQAAASRWRRKS